MGRGAICSTDGTHCPGTPLPCIHPHKDPTPVRMVVSVKPAVVAASVTGTPPAPCQDRPWEPRGTGRGGAQMGQRRRQWIWEAVLSRPKGMAGAQIR